MADLKEQVEKSGDDLKRIWTAIQTTTALALPLSLPFNCYEHWIGKAKLHQTLSATTSIFLYREKAWETLKAISSSVKDESGNRVIYGAVEMDFTVARHLALTSYVAVTWSIYDRLANVCGRLAAINDLSENPRQNPRLCEDFLDNKKDDKKRTEILGFGAHLHLQHAYQWPINVAYKIRNWLVHEGYEENSIPLFQGDRIADGFMLHEQAVDSLQRRCGYKEENAGIDACCLSGPEECWPARNLLDILEKYHAEIDTMFVGLVKWTVSSFIGQITAFAERDRTALTLGGVRK